MLNNVLAKKKARRKDADPKPKRVRRPRTPPPPLLARFLAWGVHLYTALGLVIAAVIAALLVEGGPEAFRWSFILMAFATFIDATDGTLARKLEVKKVLPHFDGRKLDDIIDFLNYASLPLLLIWKAQLVPSGTELCLILPLLASAYGFCQSAAKTDDGYFLGFPSLWNIVAFYLYALQVTGWAALGVVIALSVLTFVPTRYLYPSQKGRLNVVHNALAAGWTAMLGWILWEMPRQEVLSGTSGAGQYRSVVLASLFYPIFYMGASWVVSYRLWRAARTRARLERERLTQDARDVFSDQVGRVEQRID
jgi:phosphatidylcholine synthase